MAVEVNDSGPGARAIKRIVAGVQRSFFAAFTLVVIEFAVEPDVLFPVNFLGGLNQKLGNQRGGPFEMLKGGPSDQVPRGPLIFANPHWQ